MNICDSQRRHLVKVGDELLVEGSLFVVVELRVEMNKPSILTTKQPIELVEKEIE